MKQTTVTAWCVMYSNEKERVGVKRVFTDYNLAKYMADFWNEKNEGYYWLIESKLEDWVSIGSELGQGEV